VRIVLYDTTERSMPYLSTIWAAGAMFSRSDYVLAVSSWGEAYARLSAIERRISLLQVWGHGAEGRPLIAGQPVDLGRLSAVADTDSQSEVWWRACDVAGGALGHAFMRAASRYLGCRVVGHCAVISWPNPLVQREIVGLKPGQEPWWPLSGQGLPSCSALRMTPPPWAYE